MPPPQHQKSSPTVVRLQQGVALHQAGRLDEALAMYQRVLEEVPRLFDAIHLSGVIALQRGDLRTAQALITDALTIKPKDGIALNNLGTVLLRGGRLDEARDHFERAVKAQPQLADALSNLGSVLRQLGRVPESVAPLKRAYAASPRSAEVADLLGASLVDTGDGRGAATVFEAAVKLRPRDAGTWLHLSIASRMADNPKRALEAADQSLAIAPDTAPALAARARALAGLGDLDGARAAFTAGVRAAPRDAVAHHNLGVFLHEQGDLEAAIEQLRQALALDAGLKSAREALAGALIDAGRQGEAQALGDTFAAGHADDPTAFALLAMSHFAQERMEESADWYRRAVDAAATDASVVLGYGKALFGTGDAAGAARQFVRAVELDPQNARARFALAMSPPRPIYDDAGQMETSRRAFARAVAELDAWFTPARAAAGAQAIGSAQPFYLAYHPVDLRPLLDPYGRTLARLAAQGAPAPRPADERTLPPPGARKLRVGIVAAQVSNHSVWNAITQGWVRHFDRDRIELTVFHLGRSNDEETARARRDASAFVDKPATHAQWVQAIADARIDVLIYPEIGMHAMAARLAAMRLAPVQASAWGHPVTTGLPTMDLFFSAQALESPQGAAHYSERLVALPNLGVCVQPAHPLVVAPELPALGLPADEPLLLCPGSVFKYTPQGDAALVAIAAGLQARGRGRLVLFRGSRPLMVAQLEARLRKAFAKAGVDYDRTVAWIPTLDRGRFYGLMQRATAMLDTIGFSGFNTALQALECDRPVVAFEGEFMRGRLASGPLRHIGLDELVATTTQEFAAIALRLVDDEAWRFEMEREIARRRFALFDDLAPVRAWEEAMFAAVAAAA